MQLDSELKQSRVFPFATLVVSAFLGVVLLLFLAALTVSQLPVGWINQQLALRTLPILGEPLQIEGVEFALGFDSGLVLQGVSVGDRLKVGRVSADFSLRDFASGEWVVEQLVLVEPRLDLPAWQEWWQQRGQQTGNTDAGVASLWLQRVRVESAEVLPWAAQVGNFDGTVDLSPDFGFQSAAIKAFEGALMIAVQPIGGGLLLRLEGHQFRPVNDLLWEQVTVDLQVRLPDDQNGGEGVTAEYQLDGVGLEVAGFPLLFDSVKSSGQLSPTGMVIDRLEARSAESQLEAAGAATWDHGVTVTAELEVDQFDLRRLEQAYGLTGFAGTATATGVLSARLGGMNSDWQLDGRVTGAEVKPPFTALQLGSLEANYRLDSAGVALTGLGIKAYEGSIEGEVTVSWPEQGVSVVGEAMFSSLDSAVLLAAFDQDFIAGGLAGDVRFGWQQGAVGVLGGIEVTGKLLVEEGYLPGIDLAAAAGLLTRRSVTGDGTAFDLASSDLAIGNGDIVLKNLNIESAALAAQGDLTIGDLKTVAGLIRTGGNDAFGATRVPLKISGTLQQPKVRPTEGSVVGGAVGTAILGPGVGTAVGIKVGEGLENLKQRLFGNGDQPVQKPDDGEKPGK